MALKLCDAGNVFKDANSLCNYNLQYWVLTSLLVVSLYFIKPVCSVLLQDAVNFS